MSASGGKAAVLGHKTCKVFFEATWIVDGGFEGKCGDKADTRCTHQVLTIQFSPGRLARADADPAQEMPGFETARRLS